MSIQYINEASGLQGKRVILRAGFDIALTDLGVQGGPWRIRQGLSTIKFLLSKGAQITLLNHIDRPQGVTVPELSNAGIAKVLSGLLDEDVPCFTLEECLKLQDKNFRIAMIENLRFYPGEEANDTLFIKKLASLGDIYVNDAFSNSHRAHASMVGIPKLIPSYAGLLLKHELTGLQDVRAYAPRPLVLVIGGVKIETKLQAIKSFWHKADKIILGGTLANAFLQAKGFAVKNSTAMAEELETVKEFPLTTGKLYLPVDVRVSSDASGSSGVAIRPVGNIADDELILDIGPDSEILFDNIIKSAKIVIWNGPIGMFENPLFATGTRAMAKSLIANNVQASIGGGQTIEFLYKENLMAASFFLSTGGGAMLAYIAGEELPALKALENNGK